MIAAVVPVKELWAAKSRLAAALDRAALEKLTAAMLCDLLDALAGVPALDAVVVVTPDPDVEPVARGAGADVWLCDAPGLNPSIEAASQRCAPGADDAVLVVLGDVAGARADEVSQLLAKAPARGIALAPSSDGGTSALLRRPKDVIAAGFGPDSARVHRERAREANVPCVEVALPSLAVDLDEIADLRRFAAGPFDGARTRALLALWFPQWFDGAGG